MAEEKTITEAPALVGFVPIWVYLSALFVIVGVGAAIGADWTEDRSIMAIWVLFIVLAFLALGRASVWVGRKNMWIVKWYGLMWNRVPLTDIQTVVCNPKEGWGKLIMPPFQLALGTWTVMDVPMGSVATSYATGRYVRERARVAREGGPVPTVAETGGHGWLLPDGVLPGWYRWRAPLVTIVLGLSAAIAVTSWVLGL